jgi:low affinity Fe/Cu permease
MVADHAYSTTGSVTFVMVFVIQHTHERRTSATQRKLDELIRSSTHADDTLIAVEEAADDQLPRSPTSTSPIVSELLHTHQQVATGRSDRWYGCATVSVGRHLSRPFVVLTT